MQRVRTTRAVVPPNLEAVVGYKGKAKLLALYWMPGGDEIVYNDGQVSGTGNSFGWLAYVRHPIIQPLLSGLNYGSSDCEPEGWLLLDRTVRSLSYGSAAAVEQKVRKQHPHRLSLEAPPLVFSKEDWEKLQKGYESVGRKDVTPQAIQAALQEDMIRQTAMLGWLDSASKNILQSLKDFVAGKEPLRGTTQSDIDAALKAIAAIESRLAPGSRP